MKMMRNFKTKWLAGLLLAVLCLTGLWLPGSAAAEELDGRCGGTAKLAAKKQKHRIF